MDGYVYICMCTQAVQDEVCEWERGDVLIMKVDDYDKEGGL